MYPWDQSKLNATKACQKRWGWGGTGTEGLPVTGVKTRKDSADFVGGVAVLSVRGQQHDLRDSFGDTG